MIEKKIISSRIVHKHDTLANWNLVKDTFKPLAGEVCIAKIDVNDPINKLLAPAMIKVGDGTSTWGQLDWISAKAADVDSWAKKSEADFIAWVNEQIEHPDPTIDTNDNTVYRFEIKEGKFVVYKTEYVLGEAGEETLVDEYDLVTPDELTEVLKAYYTSAQVDGLVKDKLHTQAEIETVAANAATEAVAGLHAIATSGSIYDVAEGSKVSTGEDDSGAKYLVFNCGSATTVI